MTDRAYTLAEIDAMRDDFVAIERKRAASSVIGWGQSQIDDVAERKLRTALIGGVSPEEVHAQRVAMRHAE